MIPNAWFFLACVCVQMCANVYSHECTGHRLTSGVFHNHWLIYFLKQHVLLYLTVTVFPSLTSQWYPRIPYIWLLGLAETGVEQPCYPNLIYRCLFSSHQDKKKQTIGLHTVQSSGSILSSEVSSSKMIQFVPSWQTNNQNNLLINKKTKEYYVLPAREN